MTHENPEVPMIFMVIERFEKNDMLPVYRRFAEAGRQLPEGLEYVDSWVAADFSRCWQLMRCDRVQLLQRWVLAWQGTGTTFEIVPVATSTEAREAAQPRLG